VVRGDEEIKAALSYAQHQALVIELNHNERLELRSLRSPVPRQYPIYVFVEILEPLPAACGQDLGLRVVAQPAGELGQVLRVVVEIAAVEPFQPALPADLVQVGRDLGLVEPRLGDQEDLRFHAPHVTARYRPAVAAPPDDTTGCR
jgi:hypothetical protein